MTTASNIKPPPPPYLTIGALAKSVENLTVALLEARAAENEARSRATGALNALNEATKAFDIAVQELRKSAPPHTDWRRPIEQGEPSA